MGLASQQMQANRQLHRQMLGIDEPDRGMGRRPFHANGNAAPLVSTEISPCVHRWEKKPVGKLDCPCGTSPEVYICGNMEVASGYCLLTNPNKWSDGKISYANGQQSDIRYVPMPNFDVADAKPDVLPTCRSCKLRKPPELVVPRRRIILNANQNGIGDAALACWYPEVEFLATGPVAETVRIFGGRVTADRVGAKSIYDSWGDELRSYEPRLQFRAEFLGATIIRRPSVNIADGALAWAKEQRTPGKPMVVLAPQSAHGTREWPVRHFMELGTRLIELGYDVIVDVLTDRGFAAKLPRVFVGNSIQKMAALIWESDLVIASDSGPAHFAGNMDKPCLLLMGPTIRASYAHVPSVTCMTSGKHCTHCNFQPPHFNGGCNPTCGSLSELMPEVVLAKAVDMLNAYAQSH